MTGWSSISDDDGVTMIAGIGMIALSMVLVGRAVIARQRLGQPVTRHALIWIAIIAIGFAVATTIDLHPQ